MPYSLAASPVPVRVKADPTPDACRRRKNPLGRELAVTGKVNLQREHQPDSAGICNLFALRQNLDSGSGARTGCCAFSGSLPPPAMAQSRRPPLLTADTCGGLRPREDPASETSLVVTSCLRPSIMMSSNTASAQTFLSFVQPAPLPSSWLYFGAPRGNRLAI